MTDNLRDELADAKLALIDLEEELEETNRGMIALAIELENARDQYLEVFESAHSGIYRATLDGKFFLTNDTSAKILNYCSSEDLCNSIKDIATDMYVEETRFVTLLGRLMRDGSVEDFQSQVKCRDGRTTWISEDIKFISDDDGKISGYASVMKDIYTIKDAAEKLRLISKVFEHSFEAIMITDDERVILQINSAFADITGFSPDEVIGNNISWFANQYAENDLYTEIWQTAEQQEAWQGELEAIHKNGGNYTQWLTICSVKNETSSITNFICMFSDITEKKSIESQMHRLAYYDALTDLPNRVLLHDRIQHALAQAARKGEKAALLFIDLDNFKIINDSYGHNIGDKFLQKVARRLKASIRTNETVARIGGDEFVILLENLQKTSGVDRVISRIFENFKKPINFEDHQVYCSFSLGVAIFPDDGSDSDSLLKNADSAMYLAKNLGKNNFQYFTQSLNERSAERIKVETDIRHALKKGEFELYYQPQINLSNSEVIGMEALIRWNHSELGMIPPDQFIPIAEESDLIEAIGQWVIEEACRQSKEWLNDGYLPIKIAVNLSARQLLRQNIVKILETCISTQDLDPGYLCMEVTETAVMTDPVVAQGILSGIADLGVSIAIDDFGTGYSSLSYLKAFPCSILKIDRKFINEIKQDEADLAIVSAVVSIAHKLNMQVIAEGVETIEQLKILKTEKCDMVQGYYFGKPQKAKDARKLLTRYPQKATSLN